ncbi:FAD-dependent oxidoreductase [Microbacterium sp. A8/3-1]|uniref:FAD-dependent oxidoreductase n=1 Tax=Microbacterium sp. A8/3-1 TaxID=3160749 RepID=A0AAU7VXX4_9MICO
MLQDDIVVVGAGQAAVHFADSMRKLGFDGRLTIIGDETDLPYQRPPLSKESLKSLDEAPSALPLRGPSFFEQKRVILRTPHRAVRIARDRHDVELESGEMIPYAKLVIATGVRNRRLGVAGEDAVGVHSIRTVDDSRAVWAHLSTARRPVVIGAGFIGLEFAAAAAHRGLPVTVIASSQAPMRRSLTPHMSQWFRTELARRGISVLYGQQVHSISVDARGNASGVRLLSGEVIEADLVLVAVGVHANDELAVSSGLQVDDGIVVDSDLVTSDPDIYALGDCARYPSRHARRFARLESVQNASGHAEHLAAVLAGGGEGTPDGYSEVPWFWSHQGDLKLNIVGIPGPESVTIVRGDERDGSFSVFAFTEGELVCVESVNATGDHMAARRILTARRLPSMQQIADPEFDLKAFSKSESRVAENH